MRPPDDDESRRDRANLIVILVVAVIVVIGGYLMYLLKQNLDLQKCEMERRMDCHAIAVPEDR